MSRRPESTEAEKRSAGCPEKSLADIFRRCLSVWSMALVLAGASGCGKKEDRDTIGRPPLTFSNDSKSTLRNDGESKPSIETPVEITEMVERGLIDHEISNAIKELGYPENLIRSLERERIRYKNLQGTRYRIEPEEYQKKLIGLRKSIWGKIRIFKRRKSFKMIKAPWQTKPS